MDTSASANGMEAPAKVVQSSSVQSVTSTAQTKHGLSDHRNTSFDNILNTSCAESPEQFSNQGISTINMKEMSYWSIELHNFGCKRSSG